MWKNGWLQVCCHRKCTDQRTNSRECRFRSFTNHPNAVISRRVEIGIGSVVMAGAVINSDTVIGRGCIVNTGASVDHDCDIKDYVHIAVGVHAAGTCTIGKGTWIGAGATVSNNENICGGCMVGAGAVVVRDIEEVGTYVGVPVKEKGMNKPVVNIKNHRGGVTHSRVISMLPTCEVAA